MSPILRQSKLASLIPSLRSLFPKLLFPTVKTSVIPPKVLAIEESVEQYCPGGYHPVNLGDTFDGGRFSVIRKLGWGQYSTVWLAKDARDKCHVALKILTHNFGMAALSSDEVSLLGYINEAVPSHPGREHVVLMKHHFEHVGPNGTHICIVFELLGPSIREIVRLFRGRGLPQILVKQIAAQTLLALDFLQRSCGIIHSDVKPDNMLLYCTDAEAIIQDDSASNPARVHALAKDSEHVPTHLAESQPLIWSPLLDPTRALDMHLHVKLADLGAANWIDKHTVDVIEPMALRAPEVILGAKWGPSAEIWGLGCVVYYLLSGSWMIDPRFAAEHNITEEAEILLQATILFGDVPMELIKAGTRGKQFYANNSDKLSGVRIEVTDFDLHKLIEMDPPHDLPASDVDLFVDFLSRMVKILPRERETPAQLLKHPWLQEYAQNDLSAPSDVEPQYDSKIPKLSTH